MVRLIGCSVAGLRVVVGLTGLLVRSTVVVGRRNGAIVSSTVLGLSVGYGSSTPPVGLSALGLRRDGFCLRRDGFGLIGSVLESHFRRYYRLRLESRRCRRYWQHYRRRRHHHHQL